MTEIAWLNDGSACPCRRGDFACRGDGGCGDGTNAGRRTNAGTARMNVDTVSDFADHLRRKYALADDVLARAEEARDGQSALRRLWQSTDLSANDFADEVAEF